MILSPQVLPYTRSRSIIVALIGRSRWTLKPGAEVLRNGTDGEGHADENDPLMAAKVNFALNYSDGIIINNCSSSSSSSSSSSTGSSCSSSRGSSSGIRGSSSDADLYTSGHKMLTTTLDYARYTAVFPLMLLVCSQSKESPLLKRYTNKTSSATFVEPSLEKLTTYISNDATSVDHELLLGRSDIYVQVISDSL